MFELINSCVHYNTYYYTLPFYFTYSLLDASLNVKSGLIDVQGNTFESLTGKPFISLEPATSNLFQNLKKLYFIVI